MSASLRPWMADYLLRESEKHHTSLLSAKPDPAKPSRLVQLTKFITFGDSDKVNPGFVWARVSDGKMTILVRIGKQCVEEYSTVHNKRLTFLKSALGNLRSFKPMLARVPLGNNKVGLTEKQHLCLDAEAFEPIGSFGEAEYHTPKDVHDIAEIANWVTRLTYNGRVPNTSEVVATTFSTDNAAPPLDAKIEVEDPKQLLKPVEVPIGLPRVSRPVDLKKLAAEGRLAGRPQRFDHVPWPATFKSRRNISPIAQQAPFNDDQPPPRKKQRCEPIKDALDLDGLSEPETRYSPTRFSSQMPSSPDGGRGSRSPTIPISNWGSSPPRRQQSTEPGTPTTPSTVPADPSSPPSPVMLSRPDQSFEGSGSRADSSKSRGQSPPAPSAPRASHTIHDFTSHSQSHSKENRPLRATHSDTGFVRGVKYIPNIRRKASPPPDPNRPWVVVEASSQEQTQSQGHDDSQSQPLPARALLTRPIPHSRSASNFLLEPPLRAEHQHEKKHKRIYEEAEVPHLVDEAHDPLFSEDDFEEGECHDVPRGGAELGLMSFPAVPHDKSRKRTTFLREKVEQDEDKQKSPEPGDDLKNGKTPGHRRSLSSGSVQRNVVKGEPATEERRSKKRKAREVDTEDVMPKKKQKARRPIARETNGVWTVAQLLRCMTDVLETGG